MAEAAPLTWTSPDAEDLEPQNFKATRGENVDITFSRQSSSTRVITGATITVRFATSESAQTTLKISATVSGTGFTANLSALNSASIRARKWYFQAFDETGLELLSWGWMTLRENSDIADTGSDALIYGYVPLSRILTIGGVAYDLSANRTWVVGNVGTEYDAGTSGTSKTIDFAANGTRQKVSLTGNCTFTFTPPTGVADLQIKITDNGTGGWTRTWPGAVTWIGGVAPPPLTSGEVQIVFFYYDGTTYFGDFTPSSATYLVITNTSAPSDANVATSTMDLWFDNTVGATALRAKCKDSAGTVVNKTFLDSTSGIDGGDAATGA